MGICPYESRIHVAYGSSQLVCVFPKTVAALNLGRSDVESATVFSHGGYGDGVTWSTHATMYSPHERPVHSQNDL